MKFIINDDIYFYSEDCILRKGSEDVLLPPVCARILTYLLQNNNSLIPRDKLLQVGWEDIGLSPSNNSLNNYVVLLRKSFNNFGVQDFLITIPKYGFSIKIDSLTVENIENRTHGNKKKKVTKCLALITLMIFIFLMALYIFLDSSSKTKYSNYHLYNSIDRCNVFYHKDVVKSSITAYLKTTRAEKIMSSCKKVMADIFFDDEKDRSGSPYNSTILTFCSKDSKGNVSECKNHIDAINE